MKKPRPIVYVLSSGGIDSTACVHYYVNLQSDVRPIFIDYGQAARIAELSSAQAVANHYRLSLQSLSLRGIAVPTSGQIMGRNALLLSAALMAVGAEAGVLALGIHAGTEYFDCGTTFVEIWASLLTGYTDGRVQLGVPFLKLKKADIIAYCSEAHVPLDLTWSCESSSDSACGKCLSCRDRGNVEC